MFRIPLPLPESSLLLTPPWPGLAPVVQWGVLFLLCIIPLVLLVWLYRYELRLLPRLNAFALLCLRLTVLALLLFLVCLQPVFARDRTYELPGRVLVVVDRSASMDVTDPQREPARKLRLVRALGLAKDLASDDQLKGWAEALEGNKEIPFVSAEEGKDPQKRRQLEAERRTKYEQVLARADDLTRSQAAWRILGPEGLKLVAALEGRGHTVEVMGFHKETWDVEPGKLAELFAKPNEGKKDEKKEEKKPEKEETPLTAPGAEAFTDIRLPLVRALERSGPGQGKVLGVVLLSDGQHNWGDPPSAKARELGERGVPIFAVALGARKPPPDVALVSVRGPNHTVFKDVDANIDVAFKVTGLKAQDFIVELFREGKEKKLLAQKTISHDGKDREYTERFPVRMDEVGTQTITASVRAVNPDEKESRPDNNTLATSVSVADDKAKVLVIDGEARWELHYLQTALQRDRSIELQSVVFDQPRIEERLSPEEAERLGLPKRQLPAGPDALAGYQCIILGDVDPERFNLAERQRLERYVADAGGTLVILAGKRFMPLGFPEPGPAGEADPLRKLLPLDGPRALAPENGFPLVLAQGGRDMKFMQMHEEKEENDLLWAGRPRPWGWAVAGRAKPGATPLAFVPSPADSGKPASEREKAQAVIVRHNYGFGRVLFVGIDSTWRWRYKVGDTYHHRFWGQAIRWAAADKPLVVGNRFLRFGTPQPVYRPKEDIQVVVRLNDALGPIKPDLLAGARIIRLPERPEQKEQAVALVPLSARPSQPRVLEGKVPELSGGKYAVELAIPDLADKLVANAEPGGEAKPLRASFALLPPESREMVDLETRWPVLEDMAAKSGGQVYTPEDAGQLVQKLTSQSIKAVEHRELKLYQLEKGLDLRRLSDWLRALKNPAVWMMLAVVGLLALEWVARKLAGLP